MVERVEAGRAPRARRSLVVPERTSRALAAFVAVCVALPVTAMFVLFSPSVLLGPAIQSDHPPQVALGILTGVAYAGSFAGWLLLVSFVAGGNVALRRRSREWWRVSRLGAILVLLGLFALLFVDVPYDFASWWWPGDDFKLFGLGAPLLLSHLHLELEAALRR
jgi:H+/Cl- antiporter ClcA